MIKNWNTRHILTNGSVAVIAFLIIMGNKAFVKPHMTGNTIFEIIIHNHLNDFMAPFLILSVMNILLGIVGGDYEWCLRPSGAISMFVIITLWYEVYFPYAKGVGTADVLDVVAYGSGSGAWVLLSKKFIPSN